PGGLGGTYGGSPLGCAAALAVLQVIEQEQLCQRATEIGARIVASLKQLQNKYPHKIGNVRNLGAMIAMELVREGDVNRPDAELTKAIVAEAARNGLILLSCGIRGNVIRFLPALTITDALIEESMLLLDKTLAALL
ncbi:MAG: aminotransferase class III-fold pyridoxal phosphate-dependent enzyme, partial [Motiliproteus sp.]